ncbi:MAG TPA: hypothetical protein DEH11_16485 [Actinobacteria bacterium]|jgi:hypothetical protein|nr:hypothetical protein [Actinomycetota bacterium]
MSQRPHNATAARPAGHDGTPAEIGADQATAALAPVAGERDAGQSPAAPGTQHSDPVLAARGGLTCEHGHGIYIRRDPQLSADREAGCMTTGVICTADPACRHPAHVETGICSHHRRAQRHAQMQRSPSLTIRILGRALEHRREQEREAG